MIIMISWIALGAALLALVYARKLQQEIQSATRRLDRYNRALFDANDEIRRLQEQLTATAAELRVAIRQQGQEVRFEPQMTVHEVSLLHPQAEQILASFHLGGCSSCALDPNETLAQACAEHGQDLNQVLRNLNLLLNATPQPTNGRLQSVKTPNVELNFS